MKNSFSKGNRAVSDLRFDPVSNQWVAIARNRQERPMEFVPLEQVRLQLMCPFCIGNEDATPPAIATYRLDGSQFGPDDDATQWAVRVIPNKYPSFSTSKIPSEQKPCLGQSMGPYQSACLPGEQELVVPTSRHVSSLSDLNDQELLASFIAYQDRVRHVGSLEHVRHTMLFLNCRSSAGASLAHLHAQLIGSPVISEHLLGRQQRNELHFKKHEISLIESLAKWEVTQRQRMVFESDHFYVFCPYASRCAFQICIVPKHSKRRFVDAPFEMREELARNCRWLVAQLEDVIDQPGYNMVLHHAPVELNQYDHWYFEILPRLTRSAGFELGTDIWINPVAPETAAKRLRMK